jgi:hypothetical protein
VATPAAAFDSRPVEDVMPSDLSRLSTLEPTTRGTAPPTPAADQTIQWRTHQSWREGFTVADNTELIVRFHPVAGEDVTLLTTDFGEPEAALQAIARALDERRSLILTHARYNREAGENTVVVNLANVVFVRVSRNDSETTGQYL